MTKANPSASVKRQAWVRFYPDDFIGGTVELSAHDTGVYITLLARMYACEGRIKNDRQSLARLCGTTTRNFSRALKTLIESGKIVDEGSTLTNKRALQELKLSSHLSSVQSEKAKKRWDSQSERKPNKNNGRSKNQHELGINSADAAEMPARASPEPETPPIVPPLKPDASPPAFKGALFVVSKSLFDSWRESYWAIPDLRAEIAALDVWATGRWTKANWKNLLAAKLNEKHQARVADGAKQPLSEEARAKLDDWKKRFDAAGEMDFGPERDAALAALRDEAKTAKANLEAWATY